jgi:hypothetical protein
VCRRSDPPFGLRSKIIISGGGEGYLRRLALKIHLIFIVDVFAEIADDPFYQEWISFGFCMAVPVCEGYEGVGG